ncbi:MAG: hypothetical protein HRT36_03670 [Alphaproteobacteria bacterium]|nr:hypothetical protein [Alphaproteobacteria bacterium]
MQKQAMGMFIRRIEKALVRTRIGMANIVYNMRKLRRENRSGIDKTQQQHTKKRQDKQKIPKKTQNTVRPNHKKTTTVTLNTQF